MATVQLGSAPTGAAPINHLTPNATAFGTAMAHTWYLTGRKLHEIGRAHV